MQYSMVLTKAAFVHAKYLKLYSGVSDGTNEVDRKGEGDGSMEGGTQWGEVISKAMSKTRDYVDANRNCEDIAMQMVRLVHGGGLYCTYVVPYRLLSVLEMRKSSFDLGGIEVGFRFLSGIFFGYVDICFFVFLGFHYSYTLAVYYLRLEIEFTFSLE